MNILDYRSMSCHYIQIYSGESEPALEQRETAIFTVRHISIKNMGQSSVELPKTQSLWSVSAFITF